MNVSDIMIRQIEHLRSGDQIGGAVLGILTGNLDSIPVCEGKRLIGAITRRAILENLFSNNKQNIQLQDIQKKASDLFSQPVSRIMDKNTVTVDLETSLIKTHLLMDQNDLETLPVVDSQKRLVGIISKIDVFRSLIGQKNLFTGNSKYHDFLSGSAFETVDWENRFKHELPDLIPVFEKNKVKTILDIGCGTGQFSIELANRGYSVVGVDLSSRMIEEANSNKLKLRRKSTGDVSFWNKEAEDFLFDFDLTFDAILFMSNSLSYNTNNYRHVIKRSANSLSNNGIMIFQIKNFIKSIQVNKKLVNFNIISPEDDKAREYAFIEFLDDPVMNKTVFRNLIMLVSEHEKWKWSGQRNTLMAYTDEERVRSVLENEGFNKIETFGSAFDGKHWDYPFRKPFDPLQSDWLNVIASKK